MIHSYTFLRRVLAADAVTCLASGLALTLGSGAVGALFGLPREAALPTGIFLLAWAALLAGLARQAAPSRPLVWAIVGGNALWAGASVAALEAGWISPAPLGGPLTVAQALGVACIAALQVVGLRWARAEMAAAGR